MSATLRELVDTVQDWVGDDSETDLIIRELNRATRFICSRNPMDALIERADRILDSSGRFIVPPLCRKLNFIKNADDEQVMPMHRLPTEDGLVVYQYRIIPDGLSDGTIYYAMLSGDKKSATLTQDADQEAGYGIPADTDGFALRIEGVDELFEITASVEGPSITIRPVLGEDVDGLTCTMTTNGLRRYKVYNKDMELADETIEVEYQRYHPYLYDLDDRILPDIRESVALTAVKNLLRHYKYDVDAQRLEADLQAAMAAELGAQMTSQVKPMHRPHTFSVGRNRSWKR